MNNKDFWALIRKIPTGVWKHRNIEIDTMENRRNVWK